MSKKKTVLVDMAKSYVVGATMTVPGVSGGSMAMILGIYDKLIGAVPELLSSNFKRAFIYLFLCGSCGLLGAVSASPLLEYLLTSFYSIVMFFFIGAVIGSIPDIIRKSLITSRNWPCIFYSLIGVVVVLLISYIPGDYIRLGESSFFIQILCGIAVSIGFVLPGISTTYLLVVLGLYESILTHLSSLDFIPLIPLALGVIIGTFLLTGLLKKAMEGYPSVTFPIILGFMAGSVYEVFPPLAEGWNILFPLLSFVAGFSLIFFVCKEE